MALSVASVSYIGEGGGGSSVQRVVALGSRETGPNKRKKEKQRVTSVKFGPMAKDWWTSELRPHRVPLGLGPLLLEPGILPPVVDGDQQLPDEQRRQAQEQDGTGHRQQHHQDVRTLRTL